MREASCEAHLDADLILHACSVLEAEVRSLIRVSQSPFAHMSYQSYVCLARLGGSARYFIWQTDVAAKQADRVLLDVDQCIATFDTEREARAAADTRGEGAEPSAHVP